jgi:putative phage-type endonuclease
MFTKEELEERKNYIGASEAAAVMGMSRWNSPLDIWAAKTGAIPIEEQGENLPAEVGTELEDFIARKFTIKTGKKVHAVKEAFIHKNYPYIRAHIDRKVEGERAILQCKTCAAWKWKEWEDEDIPADYIIQEYQELACSGYDKAYIAILIGNHDFKIKEVIADKQAINAVIQKEVYFWENFVKTKVMPDIIKGSDDEILQKMFPSAVEGEVVSLPDTANAMIESLEAFKQDMKALKGAEDKIKNQLKAMLGNSELGNTGLYRVKWGNVHKDEYTVKAQDYRQLRYSEIKKEKA